MSSVPEELHVQKLLRSRPWFDERCFNGLGITHKRHPKFNNLIQFSYDQIESSSQRNHPIVRECRGLILDEANNWSVVAFPFMRFFNYGEECAADIDWKTARVQEKVDGSLMILYFYDGKWRVATRNSPDAGGNVGNHQQTIIEQFNGVDFERNEPFLFRDLFWHSCEYWLKGLCKSGNLNPDYTYMCELTSPWNRVVCDYTTTGIVDLVSTDALSEIVDTMAVDTTGYASDGSRITLIGVRNNKTFEEIPVSQFAGDWHYVVKEFGLRSAREVIDAAAVLNPMKQEGFVVVDAQFNRIKIKSPAYVAIHHLKDGFGVRRIIDLIKLGEQSEVLATFPEYQKLFNEIDVKIDAFTTNIQLFYEDIKDIADQKAFALEAVKSVYPPAMFALRKGQAKDARDFVLTAKQKNGQSGIATDKLEEILGLRGIKI